MNVSHPTEHIVAASAELADCCEQLSATSRFAFDTEFVGEDSYHPRLCLIQIATNDALYLIDPFSVGSLDPLWDLINDPARQIVVHAGREEVRLCRLWSGRTPGNFFDLQVAAGLVGIGYPLSHTALVNQVLGIRLGNAQTLTEWRHRPLTSEQIQYAFDDVRYLLAIADRLTERLDAMQRTDWAEEEFNGMIDQALAEAPGENREKWRKIRGAGSLSRRDLAAVRELYAWREKQAATINRPPRSILRDDLLVTVARRHAKSRHDLQVIRGVPKKHVEAMLQAVHHAHSLPADEFPAKSNHEPDLPQEGILASILNAVLVNWANRENVAPSLIASAQDIRRIVRSCVRDGELPKQHALSEGWRARYVFPELLAVLKGETQLRITDVSRSYPIELAGS